MVKSMRGSFNVLMPFSARLDWTETAEMRVCVSTFFFPNVSGQFFYCSFTVVATFSLKIGLTVLFTYLKIILLQYFSVFSFNF